MQVDLCYRTTAGLLRFVRSLSSLIRRAILSFSESAASESMAVRRAWKITVNDTTSSTKTVSSGQS